MTRQRRQHPSRRHQRRDSDHGNRRQQPHRSKSGSRSGAASSRHPRRRRALRIPLGATSRRVRIVAVVMALAVSLCAGRLLQLQGFDAAAYGAIAERDLTTTVPLLPSRGTITDRDGVTLAATQKAVDITADPTLTSRNCSRANSGDPCGRTEAKSIVDVLAHHISIDKSAALQSLTRHDTRFVYVKKKVKAAAYDAIATDLEHRRLPGIYRQSDPIRSYPAGSVASSVVGFTDAKNTGRAGVESSLNSSLAGKPGKESYESAPNGSKIPLGDTTVKPATDGVNYQLTIDSEMQWMIQQRVRAALKKTKAKSAFAITMDIKSGEILAMANAPTFNSAHPGATSAAHRGNPAVSHLYEPGSVEKVLTSAALIDSGTANPDTKVRIPPLLQSGGRHIKDAEPHGKIKLRMRGVVAQSSNIGAALLARQMPKKTLAHDLRRFGLGSKTGIELPAEASGSVPGVDMKDYTRDQIAFGQGLSVTGVQEAAAVAGIVNNGRYNPPTVIKSATDRHGKPVPVDRRSSRKVVSAKTSAQVRDLMEAVVTADKSQANALALDNYHSGGKTGTAQRYEPKCGCYRGYVTSYVGFAPLKDPKILTYVVINDPKKGNTGTETAAPVYDDIMSYALPRYGIQPDQKNKRAGAAKMKRPLDW
jgi:cell division protein FtsI (penicillin-binding protein 3)